MISIAQIAGMARMFLPSNSPWLARIEQAQKMAENFRQSPDGVRDLMRQLGKGREDLQKAVAMLDNSRLSGMLNRFSPGLADSLREAGRQLGNDQNNVKRQATDAMLERFRRL